MKHFQPGNLDSDLFGDQQLAKNLFEMFLMILDEEMQKSSLALKASDWNTFAAAVHKMKPNFGYLKLGKGEELCRKLEFEARNKPEKKAITQLFQELENFVVEVIPEVKNHLETTYPN